VPHPHTQVYGGNTACVQVQVNGDPTLILDGGTGLHWLGEELLKGDFARGQGQAHLLLSHTQWSHIQGIPFFVPMLVPGNRFTICGCSPPGSSLAALLLAQMDPSFCPVPNFFDHRIGARVEIRDLRQGDFALGSLRVMARPLSQVAGQPCLGYRLQAGGAVLAYLPEVEYLEEGHRNQALELARDANLLIHDARFTAAEYPKHRGQGHACDRDAVEMALEAGAERLVLFNHHPERLDAGIEAMLKKYAGMDLPVEAGRERHEYILGKESA
jgi:phosphoribosyl 1,2-cyclic phosphodiesterase